VLRPAQVRELLTRDPRIIIPVGTIEPRAPHLPLGADTMLVERLADRLSAEFGVLVAPPVEYGVNAKARSPHPGFTAVRRKTLHRFMNDLVGAWEESGIRTFVILTAHGHDPHQEALSTLHTRGATVRTVDIFTAPLDTEEDPTAHGGPVQTSLLLYIDRDLVDREVQPAGASVEMGTRLYNHIYDRIVGRIFRNDE
jgi:creatinine amidohydrolase